MSFSPHMNFLMLPNRSVEMGTFIYLSGHVSTYSKREKRHQCFIGECKQRQCMLKTNKPLGIPQTHLIPFALRIPFLPRFTALVEIWPVLGFFPNASLALKCSPNSLCGIQSPLPLSFWNAQFTSLVHGPPSSSLPHHSLHKQISCTGLGVHQEHGHPHRTG